jgi:nucleotidyltransferase substrate binding protein (TIGR01987 family)
MAQNGLISDIQKWFDAIEKRNLSSHTYDEVLAREVYQFLKVFAPEFRILLNELGKK